MTTSHHVTLKDLLELGLIKSGEEITFKNEQGLISDTGNINYKGRDFTSLSNWAKEVASKMGLSKHYNGWKVVYIKDKPLAYFRDLFYSMKGEGKPISITMDDEPILKRKRSVSDMSHKRPLMSFADSDEEFDEEYDDGDMFMPRKRFRRDSVASATEVRSFSAPNANASTIVAPAKLSQASASPPTAARSGKNQNKMKRCDMCGTTVTPQWRRGPNGSGTLCNSCGVKWSIGRRRKRKNATKKNAKKAGGPLDVDGESNDSSQAEDLPEQLAQIAAPALLDFTNYNDESGSYDEEPPMQDVKQSYEPIRMPLSVNFKTGSLPLEFAQRSKINFNSSSEVMESSESDIEIEIHQQYIAATLTGEDLTSVKDESGLRAQIIQLQKENLKLLEELGEERGKRMEVTQKLYKFNEQYVHFTEKHLKMQSQLEYMEVISHNMEKENREKAATVEKLRKQSVGLTNDVSQLKMENELCKQLNNQHWQTIAKQTTLVESKDALIARLEARIKELTGEAGPHSNSSSDDGHSTSAADPVELTTA
eukprot:TRINITY_DN821_c0_g1_i1.p1 TRINITY_DN821_c0_g1~~TRINITY_DN821_c0_g1_i1.p1  ORF type:complete len:537 (-),score=92.00 TRINITY_DN821_c0_g1_i1:40-1650(-)